MIAPVKITAEEFDQIAFLPENADKILELIGGEIWEVPTNAYASEIAGEILYLIKHFIRQHGIEGHVTGADGGYWIAGERYAPDVGYLPNSKQEQLSKSGYNPVAPDLAVEVESSTDSVAQDNLRVKISNYLAAGTTVWAFILERERVEIHAPGQPVTILSADDTLNGNPVLPGFQLPLRTIFPKKLN